ncbi:hypothetical protein GCM10010123_19870 [Pilimelia anulata]|uniref:Uncharacterized protein n=1 Tax=Pilimelia anulata TaxID=53371 RepID=A0A8J3FC59_9ACTN|nr:hypothetical protein [Pilimelia anulata]GGJ90059.1 hypothetical protein GCM10010123_19870 [Pilimelia anulata]
MTTTTVAPTASTTTARPVSGSGWVAGSSLAAAETAFDLLCTEPAPLALDCTALQADGLQAGQVPLPAVRQWLLAHPGDHAASDEVWRQLILAARLDGPAWVVAAVGMAIPALAAMSRELRGRFTDADPADIDAELLTGFLEALRDRLDREQAGLLPRLRMAAWRAAWRLLTRDLDVEPLDDIEHAVPASRTPRPMVAHPDLLVLRAVQLGVIDADDAEAWIDIRLGHKAPEPHAARLGVTVDALRMRLGRADRALHAALRSGALADGVGAVERARLAAAATGRAVLRRKHTAAAATAARIGRLVRQPTPTAGVA